MIAEYNEALDDVRYILNILEKQSAPNLKVIFFIYDKIQNINYLLNLVKRNQKDKIELKLMIDSDFIQIAYILKLLLMNNIYDDTLKFDYAPKKKPVKPLDKGWLDYGSPQFYY
ncbi:MAG: hypothetical protein QXV17_06955 [Candidatus Micrarchaeaceae archaeon]